MTTTPSALRNFFLPIQCVCHVVSPSPSPEEHLLDVCTASSSLFFERACVGRSMSSNEDGAVLLVVYLLLLLFSGPLFLFVPPAAQLFVGSFACHFFVSYVHESVDGIIEWILVIYK
eukprot:gene3788-2678_t